MSYTVVGGETLKTIARNVLGDSSLWWRIADANGLAVSGDGELTAGQTLSIPKLALNANNADTFQPYDPSRVTGSLDCLRAREVAAGRWARSSWWRWLSWSPPFLPVRSALPWQELWAPSQARPQVTYLACRTASVGRAWLCQRSVLAWPTTCRCPTWALRGRTRQCEWVRSMR